jgi:hypothetical protein
MRLLHRLCLAAALCAPAPALAVPPPPNLPTLWEWPGVACSGTLQACVDAAAPGDTVRIVTDGPIAESVTLTKPLELSAGPGYAPVFSGFQTIVASTADPGDSRIHIEGLTLEGEIIVFQAGTGTLRAEVVGNQIAVAQGPSEGPAIWVSGGGSGTPMGPIQIDLSDNTITVPDSTGSSVGIDVSPGYSTGVSGRIAGNAITIGTNTQQGAIEVADASVDILGNVIQGAGFDTGIAIQNGDLDTTARIADNLVTGQGGNTGGPGAISVYASGHALALTVVNNTVVGDESGIQIGGRPDLGASIQGVVANNIAVDDGRGVNIDPAVSADLPDHHNLYFGNTIDFGDGEVLVTPGPDSVFADPLFLPASFVPGPGSPAIDAGDDASVPADLATDLAGQPRIAGARVDIGAYEAAPEPAEAFCDGIAILALGGLLCSRRRESAPASRRLPAKAILSSSPAGRCC